MNAHHATATVPARSGIAGDAPLDSWLKMRMAPAPAAHGAAVGGASVRNQLRAIASLGADPAMRAVELRRVRTLLDQERARLRQRLADGAPIAEIARAEARLLDGTITGLCHLARLLEPMPAGMAPPLAIIARGAYGRRELAHGASADLLFLVASEPPLRAHGLALAHFVSRELAGLGWQACGAKRTVCGCLAETHLDPAIASDLFAARLIWGSRGLFAELRAALAQTLSRADARAFPDTPGRSARAVLAA